MANTCITCRHCVMPKIEGMSYHCHAPLNVETDAAAALVTGQPADGWRYESCLAQRIGSEEGAVLTDTCGPQGRWYEPKAAESEAA